MWHNLKGYKMADAIANVNGIDSFAHVGEPGWHNKGQKLEQGASIEAWAQAAGLGYNIKRAYVRYFTDRAQDTSDMRTVEDRVVQFRSDTGAELGIVSDSFKTMQPVQVLEFFRQYADEGGAQLETAGALHGGRLVFALAKLGDGVAVDSTGHDRILPYLYLSTACDGTRATEVRFTAIRVVCANTDAMARTGGKAAHKTSHRTVWVPEDAKRAVEAANAEFGAYCTMARELQRVRINTVQAAEFTATLVGSAKTETGRTSSAFARVMSLFQGTARGATLDSSNGTAWGYLNAVTQYADYDTRATAVDNRLVSSMYGAGDKLKASARDLLLSTI